jgi:hypothetical protein
MMISISICVEECIIVGCFNTVLVSSDFCIPTKSNLYFANSLDTVFKEPGL